MRRNDITVLDCPVKSHSDAYAIILEMARARNVLNVGAAGNASYYRDNGPVGWLHAHLDDVADQLTGLDLDADEVLAAKQYGYEIQLGNCESVEFDRKFDLIILADVLEHVDSPASALQNMVNHLAPEGRLVLTTPNATFFGNVLNVLMRKPPRLYWDHVNLFVPENIQALCDRHGYQLCQTTMYSLVDKRSASLRIKSSILQAIGSVFPRFHSAFMCVIQRRN